ncbi:hypothetical protein BSZ35_02310 [Salinibacter sp. 10B]|nr:hypothetical protein BSZ35_02310 [Salinibacter sp. 10B]
MTPFWISMDDLPDDLTSVGSHHGNQPPTETGQEVRSPSGPDPDSTPASPTPALFQLVRETDANRIQVRVHSARAQVSSPEAETIEEVGQYRTVDELRTALREAPIEGRIAIFEDAKTETVLTDDDATADHPWIGQPRYERITFVSDDAAVSNYVNSLDRPLA